MDGYRCWNSANSCGKQRMEREQIRQNRIKTRTAPRTSHIHKNQPLLHGNRQEEASVESWDLMKRHIVQTILHFPNAKVLTFSKSGCECRL